MPGQFDRYNMKRELSLTANIAGADLGSVSRQVIAAVEQVQKGRRCREGCVDKAAIEKPPGCTRSASPAKAGRITYELRGQIPPLRQMLSGLGVGLLLAVLAIFLMLTANFQSFRLALVTVSAAPAVLAGVGLLLWLTGSTLNIQSFIGAIMGLGVAMANAILVVTFAEAATSRRRVISPRRLKTRSCSIASDCDDELCDAGRHVAAGLGAGRIRSADRPAGPRRDGKPAGGNDRDVVYSAGCVCHDSGATLDRVTFAASVG